jgi:hypothetical protein
MQSFAMMAAINTANLELLFLLNKCPYCSKTSLTGESRFNISTPQGIWTCDPCGWKQTGSPLDQ